MNIILQKTADPNNKLAKTLTEIHPTASSLTGTLKDETSVIDPVITIDLTGLSITPSELFTCNYATIPEFNRYYHVRDITVVRNNIFQLSLHCDVLMSFAAGILSSPAVVAKNASRFNLMLNDPNYKCKQRDLILMNQWAKGFDRDNDATFIVTIFGDKVASP